MPTTENKARPIRDRAKMTDHIADAMHNHCPSWSVDTLNSHPLEAIKSEQWINSQLAQEAK